jgi:hypothetical protein
MELLAWIAEREKDYPGSSLTGTQLMQDTAGLAGDDGLPWEAVAKAAARLRKRGYLDWEYVPWPNEPGEPKFIDYMNFQRTREITVSGGGFQALAAREAKSTSTQVNITGWPALALAKDARPLFPFADNTALRAALATLVSR